jgi:uncharacterized protein YbjQ (UPF0145 family)
MALLSQIASGEIYHASKSRKTRRMERSRANADKGGKHFSLGETMLITTTHTLDGKQISEYLGLVSGEAILGANIFKDFFAGIRDVVGGRSAAYEKELRKAKEIAIREMTQAAAALGGNAIVGVDLDYETIGSGQGSNMLMVSASGTAVRIS